MAPQKATLPVRFMRMTQGRNITKAWIQEQGLDGSRYSHWTRSNAFDFGIRQNTSSTDSSYLCHPPYDCKVVATMSGEGVVFIESVDPVIGPGGNELHQWMALVHTNKNLNIYEDWKDRDVTIYQDETKNSELYEEMERVNGFYGFYLIGGKQSGKIDELGPHLHLEAGYGSAPICKWLTYDGWADKKAYHFDNTSYIEYLLYVHPATSMIETSRYTFYYTTGNALPPYNTNGGDKITGGDVGGGPDGDGNDAGLLAAYQAAVANRNAAQARLAQATARIDTVEATLLSRLAKLETESMQKLRSSEATVSRWADKLEPEVDSLLSRLDEIQALF